MNFPSSLFTTN